MFVNRLLNKTSYVLCLYRVGPANMGGSNSLDPTWGGFKTMWTSLWGWGQRILKAICWPQYVFFMSAMQHFSPLHIQFCFLFYLNEFATILHCIPYWCNLASFLFYFQARHHIFKNNVPASLTEVYKIIRYTHEYAHMCMCMHEFMYQYGGQIFLDHQWRKGSKITLTPCWMWGALIVLPLLVVELHA